MVIKSYLKHFKNSVILIISTFLMFYIRDILLGEFSFGQSIYILILGFPVVIIPCLMIYFSFLIIKSKVENCVTKRSYLIIAVALISILFLGVVVLMNWIYKKDLYYNFYDFLNSENFYFLYTVVSIIFILIINKNKTKQTANKKIIKSN